MMKSRKGFTKTDLPPPHPHPQSKRFLIHPTKNIKTSSAVFTSNSLEGGRQRRLSTRLMTSSIPILFALKGHFFQKVDPNDAYQLETLSGMMVHTCFNI